MGADATWPLQQGILQHLKSDLSLKSHFGEPAKILDQNDKSAGYPSLVLGNSQARAWSSATFDGQEHELAFDLWTSKGGSAESKELAGAVIDRLHNADFPVTGHALVDMQFFQFGNPLFAGQGDISLPLAVHGVDGVGLIIFSGTVKTGTAGHPRQTRGRKKFARYRCAPCG